MQLTSNFSNTLVVIYTEWLEPAHIGTNGGWHCHWRWSYLKQTFCNSICLPLFYLHCMGRTRRFSSWRLSDVVDPSINKPWLPSPNTLTLFTLRTPRGKSCCCLGPLEYSYILFQPTLPTQRSIFGCTVQDDKHKTSSAFARMWFQVLIVVLALISL